LPQELEKRARVLALEDARKAQWGALVRELDFVRGMRRRLVERYPEAMFLPPVMVTEEERERLFEFMRVSPASLRARLPCMTLSPPTHSALQACRDQPRCAASRSCCPACSLAIGLLLAVYGAAAAAAAALDGAVLRCAVLVSMQLCCAALCCVVLCCAVVCCAALCR
jgi:hypothetical protein